MVHKVCTFIILGMLLGQGAFGKVMQAEAVGIYPYEAKSIVAVKMPRGRITYMCLTLTWHKQHIYILKKITMELIHGTCVEYEYDLRYITYQRLAGRCGTVVTLLCSMRKVGGDSASTMVLKPMARESTEVRNVGH